MTDLSKRVQEAVALRRRHPYNNVVAVMESEQSDHDLISDLWAEVQRLRKDAAAKEWALTCSSLLAIHVKGHFALPTKSSEAVCVQWANKTNDAIDEAWRLPAIDAAITDADEARVDVIGSNGNDGAHYE